MPTGGDEESCVVVEVVRYEHSSGHERECLAKHVSLVRRTGQSGIFNAMPLAGLWTRPRVIDQGRELVERRPVTGEFDETDFDDAILVAVQSGGFEVHHGEGGRTGRACGRAACQRCAGQASQLRVRRLRRVLPGRRALAARAPRQIDDRHNCGQTANSEHTEINSIHARSPHYEHCRHFKRR